MGRKKKKVASYKQREIEEESRILTQNIYTCTSCGDSIPGCGTKGLFNCPNCGWENNIE